MFEDILSVLAGKESIKTENAVFFDTKSMFFVFMLLFLLVASGILIWKLA